MLEVTGTIEKKNEGSSPWFYGFGKGTRNYDKNAAEWGTLNGKENYVLNLIDYPGHIDFSYEALKSFKSQKVLFYWFICWLYTF